MAHQPLCTCACHDITQLKSQIATQHSQSDVLSTLDQHIATLEARILSIRALRNHYTPIATLSTEILADILTEVVRPIDQFQPQSWQTHVELTRVCQLWRGVAMECAAFWSCIPLRGHHMEEMLARSKQYPLSIRVTAEDSALTSWDPASIDIRAIVTPQRLRELHLAGNRPYIPELLNSIPEDLLALESLDIEWQRSSSLPVPAHILSAPRLRHLRLADCHVLWESITAAHPFLHNLCTLCIHFESPDPNRPTLPYHLLLSILRDSSPHLKSLRLAHTIGFDNLLSSSELSHTQISLSHLKELNVVDRPSRTASLLSHIAIPPTTRVDLFDYRERQHHGQDEQTTEETFRSLFRSCGLGDTGFGIRRQSGRMHIQFEPEASFICIQMALSVTDGSHTESEEYVPARRTFYLMATQRSEHASILLDHLHVQKLENLYITIRPDPENNSHQLDTLDTLTWISFFKRHPSIRRLFIDGSRIANVLDALGSPGPTGASSTLSGAEPPDQVLTGLALPLLEVFILQGVRFSRREPLGQSNYTSLKEALAARQSSKLTVARIEIFHYPDFDDQIMRELERLNGTGTVIQTPVK